MMMVTSNSIERFSIVGGGGVGAHWGFDFGFLAFISVRTRGEGERLLGSGD